MGLFNKKELARIAELEKENAALQETLAKTHGLSIAQEEKYLETLQKQKKREMSVLANLIEEVDALESKKNLIQKNLDSLNLEVDYAEIGLYKSPYSAMTSDEYKVKLDKNRQLQKAMVKNGTAVTGNMDWTVNGDKKAGQKMVNDAIKMVLRAFNNECTVIVSKVKYGNFENAKNQIRKNADQIEKLNKTHSIQISESYIGLKLDELSLQYQYLQEKQREKEILKEQRAAERELAKQQKEIEAKKKTLQKEQTHYQQAKEKFEALLLNPTTTEEEKAEIRNKIAKIDRTLYDIDTNLKDVDYREANQKAGYVYIISNIGSFGKDVYKIGMTRRLEPLDRIDELGSASVPFQFDVHAMIFSDDAPALEAKLHQRFDHQKVNMVNGRKEFFKVPLAEIMKAVKEYHAQAVEFTEEAEAAQYRESQILRQNLHE